MRAAVIAVLLGALVGATRADGQESGSTRWEGGTGTGVKLTADFDGKTITVFRKGDVCPLEYSVQGSLAKPLRSGEQANLVTCTISRCTHPDLKEECSQLKESFQTPCHGSVRMTNGFIRVSITYPDERYHTKTCSRWSSQDKDSVTDLAVFQPQQPAKPRDPYAPATPTPTTSPGQSSSSWLDVGSLLNCWARQVTTGGSHPLGGECQ